MTTHPLITELDRLPAAWALVAVGNDKRPYQPEWQKNPLTRDQLATEILAASADLVDRLADTAREDAVRRRIGRLEPGVQREEGRRVEVRRRLVGDGLEADCLGEVLLRRLRGPRRPIRVLRSGSSCLPAGLNWRMRSEN